MKAFVDTNVLVYAHDASEIKKRPIAQTLLENLEAQDLGVVSTQVFLEFATVARAKLKLSAAQIAIILRQYRLWECVGHDTEMILQALECSEQELVSIWDAMRIVASVRARCEVLYTEDLNHGQVIRGVRIVNPFQG